MRLKFTRRILKIVGLGVVCASLASASTIDWYTNIFALPDIQPAATAIPPAGSPTQYATPFITIANIPQFNPSLGTLTSVFIEFFWDITANVGVVNTDIAPPTNHDFANATAEIPVDIIGPDGTVADGTAASDPCSGTALPFPAVNTCEPTLGSGQSDNTVIGPGLLLYQGLGMLDFDVNVGNGTFGGSEIGGSGHLFFGGTATVGLMLHVEYTYTPEIPEPGTWAMVGGSILVAAFALRRKTRSKAAKA